MVEPIVDPRIAGQLQTELGHLRASTRLFGPLASEDVAEVVDRHLVVPTGDIVGPLQRDSFRHGAPWTFAKMAQGGESALQKIPVVVWIEQEGKSVRVLGQFLPSLVVPCERSSSAEQRFSYSDCVVLSECWEEVGDARRDRVVDGYVDPRVQGDRAE